MEKSESGGYKVSVRQGIEAETVSDCVLDLLRTIESGGGDRKEGIEAET